MQCISQLTPNPSLPVKVVKVDFLQRGGEPRKNWIWVPLSLMLGGGGVFPTFATFGRECPIERRLPRPSLSPWGRAKRSIGAQSGQFREAAPDLARHGSAKTELIGMKVKFK